MDQASLIRPEKYYFSINEYFQKKFGSKTFKVSLSSGLTCPTWDGTLGKGGCAFCDIRGAGSFHNKKTRSLSVQDQINSKIQPLTEKYSARKFLAYFQSYTNTYTSVDRLRTLYEDALSHPKISGLCIGTRPDCIPDPVLEYLEELSQKHYVCLELGVQSFHDDTLLWLGRGHDSKCSLDALERVARIAPHLQVVVHLMFGAPTEPESLAKDTALTLNQFPIHGVKPHQLMVLKHSELWDRYHEKAFPLLTKEKYSQLLCEFISHLRPDLYVERLFATASHPEECLGPEWSKTKWVSYNYMLQEFENKKITQGGSLKNSTLS